MNKSNVGKRGLVWFIGLEIITQGKPRQEVEAGTEAEIPEEGYLPSCSSWLAQSFSYTAEDHLLRRGSAHSGLWTPISTTNHDEALQSYL